VGYSGAKTACNAGESFVRNVFSLCISIKRARQAVNAWRLDGKNTRSLERIQTKNLENTSGRKGKASTRISNKGNPWMVCDELELERI
jgi:hypothetical protein